MKNFGIKDLDYGPDKGPMETALDNATQKPKTKREVMDAALARGEFLPGEFNANVRLSNDAVLDEIKKTDDVKYNKHTGKFEDEAGNVFTLKEAAKQNYQNFRRHKAAGFKKAKNANNRSRDLLEEQRKFLGWPKKQMTPTTLETQSVNSESSQELIQNQNTPEIDIEAHIKKVAAEKIAKEDEELRRKFGTRGIASLGDWNV